MGTSWRWPKMSMSISCRLFPSGITNPSPFAFPSYAFRTHHAYTCVYTCGYISFRPRRIREKSFVFNLIEWLLALPFSSLFFFLVFVFVFVWGEDNLPFPLFFSFFLFSSYQDSLSFCLFLGDLISGGSPPQTPPLLILIVFTFLLIRGKYYITIERNSKRKNVIKQICISQ